MFSLKQDCEISCPASVLVAQSLLGESFTEYYKSSLFNFLKFLELKLTLESKNNTGVFARTTSKFATRSKKYKIGNSDSYLEFKAHIYVIVPNYPEGKNALVLKHIRTRIVYPALSDKRYIKPYNKINTLIEDHVSSSLEDALF